MENKKMTRALFYDSFDPFTIGHFVVLSKALALFDQVCVCVNDKEGCLFSCGKRVELINATIKDFVDTLPYHIPTHKHLPESFKFALDILTQTPTAVEVFTFKGVILDAALSHHCSTIICESEEKETKLVFELSVMLKSRKQSVSTQVFPQPDCSYFSKTVKKLMKKGEYITASYFVSPSVFEALSQKALKPIYVSLCESFEISAANALCHYKELKKAYTDRRRYHTLSHISHSLNMATIYHTIVEQIDDKQIFDYALFYHDFYQEGSNAEELSAQMAISVIANAKVTKQQQDDIIGLILATKHLDNNHKNGKEKENTLTERQKTFSDIDLSVLGMDGYREYALKVRQEYSQFTDSQYAKGRIEVLTALLFKKPLFHTPYFHKHFEKDAHANISKEVLHWGKFIE